MVLSPSTPKAPCQRCKSNHHDYKNYLLTCKKCHLTWHNKCVSPPLPYGELEKIIQHTLNSYTLRKHGIHADLYDEWTCPSCLKIKSEPQGVIDLTLESESEDETMEVEMALKPSKSELSTSPPSHNISRASSMTVSSIPSSSKVTLPPGISTSHIQKHITEKRASEKIIVSKPGEIITLDDSEDEGSTITARDFVGKKDKGKQRAIDPKDHIYKPGEMWSLWTGIPFQLPSISKIVSMSAKPSVISSGKSAIAPGWLKVEDAKFSSDTRDDFDKILHKYTKKQQARLASNQDPSGIKVKREESIDELGTSRRRKARHVKVLGAKGRRHASKSLNFGQNDWLSVKTH
ncbi:hypothetical protein C8Q75DRAFT_145865 [Abortiporus biennis]|nr:hypothetical protein C8Q75DRAFT_145865 [Abortiporus biennis]